MLTWTHYLYDVIFLQLICPTTWREMPRYCYKRQYRYCHCFHHSQHAKNIPHILQNVCCVYSYYYIYIFYFFPQPNVIIHSAANRRVDVIEKDPVGARKTNIDATRYICEAACMQHMSNYVFKHEHSVIFFALDRKTSVILQKNIV